jgi:uncharacterized membrane protein YciS (DUF1049 family)
MDTSTLITVFFAGFVAGGFLVFLIMRFANRLRLEARSRRYEERIAALEQELHGLHHDGRDS